MTTKEIIAKFSNQVLTSSEVRAYTVELLQSILDGLEVRKEVVIGELHMDALERELRINELLLEQNVLLEAIAELKEAA